MTYTIYDTLGQITFVFNTTDPEMAAISLKDKNYIEGQYFPDEYYIENGVAVKKPTDPSTDLKKYVFNYNTKTYDLLYDYTELSLRQQRNLLLADVDRVNPVWYSTLTESQQQELKTYRQALLDVPQQAGFPEVTEWPTKPHWL